MEKTNTSKRILTDETSIALGFIAISLVICNEYIRYKLEKINKDIDGILSYNYDPVSTIPILMIYEDKFITYISIGYMFIIITINAMNSLDIVKLLNESVNDLRILNAIVISVLFIMKIFFIILLIYHGHHIEDQYCLVRPKCRVTYISNSIQWISMMSERYNAPFIVLGILQIIVREIVNFFIE